MNRFSLLILASLTASAVAFAPSPVYKEPKPRPAKSLFEQMQGKWEVTSKNALPTLVIENDIWSFSGRKGAPNNKLMKIAYRMILDSTQQPATLDLQAVKGSRTLYHGIVKVENDTLTFVYTSVGAGTVRPTTFELGVKLHPKGQPSQGLTFKRAK